MLWTVTSWLFHILCIVLYLGPQDWLFIVFSKSCVVENVTCPSKLLIFVPLEKVHVKCNQTGKTFKAKVTALSKENAEPIVSLCDLAEGAELFLDVNDKSYPVTVIKVVDESKSCKPPFF